MTGPHKTIAETIAEHVTFREATTERARLAALERHAELVRRLAEDRPAVVPTQRSAS